MSFSDEFDEGDVDTSFCKVRVFFEGVEFPYVQSIQINESISSTRCTMRVPPSIKLKPEEMVGMKCHVFYLTKHLRDKYDLELDPQDTSNWPVLFQGELAGDQENRMRQSSQVTLNFVGHTRHFEQTQLHFFDPSRSQTSETVQAQTVNAFLGNTKIQIEASGLLSKTTRILENLVEKVKEMESDSNRFVAYQAMIKTLVKEGVDAHRMFKVFNRQLKLGNRFGSFVDPDVKHMLGLKEMGKLLKSRAKKLPSYVPFMKLLNHLASITKYNWNHITTPVLNEGDTATNREGEELDQAAGLRQDLYEAVESLKNKLDPMLRTVSDRSFQERTSVQIWPNDRIYVKLSKDEVIAITDSVNEDFGTKKVSQEEFVEHAMDLYNQGYDLSKAFLYTLKGGRSPERQYGGPGRIAQYGAYPAKTQREKVFDKLGGGINKKEIDEAYHLEQQKAKYKDQLHEFVLTPSMEFTQPPKCNVIIPRNLTGWTISRNFLKEPTRLYGKAKVGPNTPPEIYIAPESQALYNLQDKGRGAETLSDKKQQQSEKTAKQLSNITDNFQE